MTNCQRTFITLCLAATLDATPIAAAPEPFGEFVGTVQAEWLDDGRRMRLLADFGYVSPDGSSWPAPKGSVVDGASIPQVFWTLVGGPFEGKYRGASVIHDVACDRKDRPWKAVHRAFYSASRRAGVSMAKAKIMYAAVYHFGPRWGPDQGIRALTEFDARLIRSMIESNPNIGLDQIDEFTSQQLQRDAPSAGFFIPMNSEGKE